MGVFNWILKECRKFEIKETLEYNFYKINYNFYYLFSFTSTAKSYQYFMSWKTIKKNIFMTNFYLVFIYKSKKARSINKMHNTIQ